MNEHNINAVTLFNLAINELAKVPSGTKFLVKDLFKGYEWANFSFTDRRVLGSLFSNYIETTPTCSVKPFKKTPQNQQIYIKE